MENHYAITETGKMLAELVSGFLKEEFDMPPERVGLGIPGEAAQFSLCIFPYDIRKDMEMPIGNFTAIRSGKLRYPSSFYDIYYMLVPYSDGDVNYRMQEELRILDVLLGRLGDISYLGEEKRVPFAFDRQDFDERVKVWSALNQPLRAAVYCKVGPVEVVSGRTKDIKRVTDVQIHFSDREEES